WLIAVVVHPANVQDYHAAPAVLAKAKERFPRLQLIFADGIYARDYLPIRILAAFNIILEIVQRLAGSVGFKVLPQRWKVERTFAWLSRNRRLSRDYERNPSVSETMIHVAMTKLMLKRLCPG